MSFDNKLRIEIRNNDGVLLSYLNQITSSVNWDWNRIGGCGECNLKVKADFDSVLAGSFSEDAEIRIYIPNANGTSQLWYSGFIDKVTPTIGAIEYLDLYCLGYVNQLKRVIVKDKTYSNQELSTIVQNIAEVYATDFTSVVSTAPFYEDSGFSADSLYFNESAFDAISKLADIAGKTEWGVDENKKLFFKRRNDAVMNYFNYKQDFASFQPTKDFDPIVTSIYLEGGDGYTQKFSVTNKISTREIIISNSSISTQSVGYRYAKSILKDKGSPTRSYQGKQIGRTTRIESTIPIGGCYLFEKIGVKLKYDVASQKYDTGLKYDGGNITLQVERIKYELKDSGINATLSFGAIPPSVSDDLSKIDYEIAQVGNII